MELKKERSNNAKKQTSSSFVPNGQHPWNLKTARRKRTGCLFNCATDDGTSERLPLYMLQEPVQELSLSVAFSITYVSKSFFRGTDGYKFLSSIFDEEGMFGPKFFGIIFFS